MDRVAGVREAFARVLGLSAALAAAVAFGVPDAFGQPGVGARPRVMAVDSTGAVIDPAVSHASITRVLPEELTPDGGEPDTDALRFVVAGRAGRLPLGLSVISSRPGGDKLDELVDVALGEVRCPPGVPTGAVCAGTAPIRACSDAIDAEHPAAAQRSLLAEVGGRIAVYADGREVLALPVAGPRRTALGPIGRYRARVRVRVVRLHAGGEPPIGRDANGAVERARRELITASRIWGQCGIHFGTDPYLDIAVVDPPPPHLLAIGCDLGLPASGGNVRFEVGGRPLVVPTRSGQTPVQVARAVALAIEARGLRAEVSVNAPTGVAAQPTADVLVRQAGGSLASFATVDGLPLSTDPTLGVCLGEVDFADGLDHFSDFDAAAGTVEERSLIKAYADADPSTVDILIIPAFAGSGRIGESFILTPQASVYNTVIMDRAGILAGARSYALAHEVGHIYLDVPGHPDDYGVDRPTELMDADAADATIFGPRRLSIGDCERAIRHSGPGAPVPLLDEWPVREER